jgi:hypothetical protein
MKSTFIDDQHRNKALKAKSPLAQSRKVAKEGELKAFLLPVKQPGVIAGVMTALPPIIHEKQNCAVVSFSLRLRKRQYGHQLVFP